jgi:hypothetical protein
LNDRFWRRPFIANKGLERTTDKELVEAFISTPWCPVAYSVVTQELTDDPDYDTDTGSSQ